MKRLLFVLFPIALLLVACSKGYVDPYKAYRTQTASQIYHKSVKQLAKGSFGDAASGLEALNAIYPFGPYAEPGQLDLIYAYYQNGDDASAVAACDRYIRLYPQNPNVAYAYYMSGVVQFTQGLTWLQRWWGMDPSTRALTTKQQSFLSFNQLVTRYPHSRYAPDAIVRMRYIRNILARQQLLTAKYYWDRGAYVASASRASIVVRHYQGTPSVIPALVLMVKSYRKLGVNSMANSTLQILQASYPKAPQLKHLS